MSIHDLSAVPSAQTSPKHSKQESVTSKPDKLPSFKVLKSDFLRYKLRFGSKQPTFDDLSNEQWVQGFLFCILDEKDSKIRENILQYYTPLMQDAIKLNIQTAKRAHAAVLQEIERGRVDWQQLNVLEN